MIQALIFDFDGLILDTESPEVGLWQDLYTCYGQEFPLDEWVRIVVGSTVANFNPLARLERLTGIPVDQLVRQEEVARSRQAQLDSLPPLPGVADMIHAAHPLGLMLAVASSSPHSWVDGALKRLGFYDHFDAVICREDAPRLKPHPDLFLAALTALQVRPEAAVALEDSPNGVRAAQAAGMRVVGVPNAITARLGPLPAEIVLDSLSQLSLPQLLDRLGDSLTLRFEAPGDEPAIRHLHEQAFNQSSEADLVDLVRRNGTAVLSMVAVQIDDVIGHVLLTPVTADTAPGRQGGLGLGPIAILPEWQRKGIGCRLMRACLEHVRGKGYDYVILLGDPAWYSRFGFKPARSFGLSSDYGDGDAFQVLSLRAGSLEGLQGLVRYVPEFDLV
jgi:HAD superfamily hydrolase (TIGR01509 family)